MFKRLLLSIFLLFFIMAGSASAQDPNALVRPLYKKMPFVADQVIVKYKKAQYESSASLSSIGAGHAMSYKKARKLFKHNPTNAGGMTALAVGSGQKTSAADDVVDEPGVYLVSAEGRSDIYSVVDELKKNPDVEYAEPNYLYQASIVPNDPEFSLQWAPSKVGAPAAWDVEKGDPNVIVAVIDTGVDYNHQDLTQNIWINTREAAANGSAPLPKGQGSDADNNGYIDDVLGWNFVSVLPCWMAPDEDSTSPNNNPMDVLGHGTHVAGIIAGRPNNGTGIAGMTWGCKIMDLKAGYKAYDGNGYLELDDIAAALHYAADNGAKVINMSFGCEYDSQTLHDAINYAYSKGCIMVASSGNVDSSDAGQPFYPAAYDHVIAVASVDNDDKLSIWNLDAFSNFGDFVAICAPGTSILSTLPNNSYGYESGTSMSAPIVSGVAALLKSKHPDWTPEQVEARLKSTADNIYGINNEGFLAGMLGAGRVNAQRALGDLNLGITYPRSDSVISGSVAIKGSANIENFSNYKIEFSSATDPNTWTTIESSSSPVDNGILGIWSVSNLSGRYNIRLTVYDASGEAYPTVSGVTFGLDGEVTLAEKPMCGPSPFDPSTQHFVFYYELNNAAAVDIYVYDITGTKIWQDSIPYDMGSSGKGGSAGANRVEWNGMNAFGERLSNGAYLYMIIAQDSGVRKIIGRGKFAVLRS